jgi:hypothetical protein
MPDDSGNERDNINNTLIFFGRSKIAICYSKGVRKTAILDVKEDMQFPYLT